MKNLYRKYMDWITAGEYEQMSVDLKNKGLDYVIKDEEKHRKHMRFSAKMAAIWTAIVILAMSVIGIFLLYKLIELLINVLW